MYSFDLSTYVSEAAPSEGWIDWRLAGDVYADFLIVRTVATTAVTADTGTITNFVMRGAWASGDADHVTMGLRQVGIVGVFGVTHVPVVTLNAARSYIVGHDDGDAPRAGASFPRLVHDLGAAKVGVLTVDVHWCLKGGKR